jgi:hypothetical protein
MLRGQEIGRHYWSATRNKGQHPEAIFHKAPSVFALGAASVVGSIDFRGHRESQIAETAIGGQQLLQFAD